MGFENKTTYLCEGDAIVSLCEEIDNSLLAIIISIFFICIVIGFLVPVKIIQFIVAIVLFFNSFNFIGICNFSSLFILSIGLSIYFILRIIYIEND